ncbi:hypothetical protein [Streptomyces sp. NPDC005799]|uniref:hypothetical protein n=1 Tax=Streptomyces sp. NPDC005799 TaxID=3154678 RepID=UPI0033DD317A
MVVALVAAALDALAHLAALHAVHEPLLFGVGEDVAQPPGHQEGGDGRQDEGGRGRRPTRG